MTVAKSAVMAVVALAAPQGTVAELPVAGELAAELVNRDSRLFALSATYQQVPARSGAAKGEYSRREIAVRSPDWFFRKNAHGHSTMHWEDDPFAKSRVLIPDRHFLFSHLNRVLEEQPLPVDGVTPEGPDNEALLHWLCWWPFPDWPAPKKAGREWQFTKLFAEDAYRVRERVELVDSRRCCVLELPHVDVMWLDLECPQRIMRRDLCAGTYGAVAERLEYGDYREVKPGIWLPHRVRSLQYDAFAHAAHLRARVVRSGTFVLSDVRVNEDVTDDCFSLPLPAGTVADVSADGVVRAINSGQAAHVESVIGWVGRVVGTQRNRTAAGWYYATASLLGFVLVALPGAVLLRKREH
jgi:hypothetical protein